MSVTLENETDGKKQALPAVALEDAPQHTGPTPEEAIAASRQAMERSENEARLSKEQARQAQDQLHRVRQDQQRDQAAVLGSAVEASTAERDRHAQAWQAAMEAGDFAAAARHNSDLAMATSRLDRASGELAMLKAAPAPQRQQQQGGAVEVSNSSQQWINSKPAFQRHKDALLLRHQELLNDGVVVESPRYFRELDQEYERLTNPGGDTRDNSDMNGNGGSRQAFNGAPPSRGGNTGTSANTVNTLLGPVGVSTRNGQTFLTIPPHLRADFDEGAKVVGMTTPEYAMDQVRIARERASGANGGLIMEEGRTYR